MFRDSLQPGRFTLSAELTLKRLSKAADVRHQAELLQPYVDGIQVTDIPYGWIQMSATAAAALLVEQGSDPVPILTCRDRDRQVLTADLKGLKALGVNSVLLTRGHRLPASHPVQAEPVFDLTGRELVALAAGADLQSEEPDDDGFFIGIGARAFRPIAGWKGESLTSRAEVGAGFMQTQLCMNMNLLRHYMKRLEEAGLTRLLRVMVTVAPLPCAETARWMRTTMKDSRIPDPIIEQLENAGDPEQEGIKICARMMQKISKIPGVSGIHLMTTGNPDAIPAAIEASGLRSKGDDSET